MQEHQNFVGFSPEKKSGQLSKSSQNYPQSQRKLSTRHHGNGFLAQYTNRTPSSEALLKFSIARVEYFKPQEFALQTGQLVQMLASHSNGLSKTDILHHFYPGYLVASSRLKESLEICLNKLLQRARNRFHPLGLEITFCKYTNRWKVVPASLI